VEKTNQDDCRINLEIKVARREGVGRFTGLPI
jgi:hypothetical protein